MFPLKKSNNFLEYFPADIITENFPRRVEDALYSFVLPKYFENPKNIIISENFAKELWFDEKFIKSPEFLEYFSGQKIIENTKSFSLAYAGHQFWNWAGQLWDGRAICLWEFETKIWNKFFQLKWSGVTPYSRFWDWYAVLRSSIREFLTSEAMFYLWIPTTRALNYCETWELVLRDMYYNGNQKYEKWALVTRVSDSFLRFWNFELFASRQDTKNLKWLAEYVIENHYPEINTQNHNNYYVNLFEKIAEKTIDLVIWWQRVWFVHGVLNTDNMSILWETIDYWPYWFLENFDPSWTPNLTDSEYKRYCFGNQKNIIIWNLWRLADSLNVLVDDKNKFWEIIEKNKNILEKKYFSMMFEKIWIYEEKNQNNFFIEDLEELLFLSNCDFTIFFRELSNINKMEKNFENIFNNTFLFSSYLSDNFPEEIKSKIITWIENYIFFLHAENISDKNKKINMDKINPKFILRNSQLDEIISQAEKGNYHWVLQIFEMIKNPYWENIKYNNYYKKSETSSKMLSCSS